MIETIRSILELPQGYQLFFDLIGAPERSRILVREFIQPKPGDRILEIGCGPGTIVPYLPPAEYVGFDVSPSYIDRARSRFPNATFICERVSQYALSGRGEFDIVLALGIVHHLDDSEARQLFHIAHDALKQGGKLVTLDGVRTDNQSRTVRYLIGRDRGHFVRREEEYVRLASDAFPSVTTSIRHDLLRIPYTHIIMQCVR